MPVEERQEVAGEGMRHGRDKMTEGGGGKEREVEITSKSASKEDICRAKQSHGREIGSEGEKGRAWR